MIPPRQTAWPTRLINVRGQSVQSSNGRRACQSHPPRQGRSWSSSAVGSETLQGINTQRTWSFRSVPTLVPLCRPWKPKRCSSETPGTSTQANEKSPSFRAACCSASSHRAATLRFSLPSALSSSSDSSLSNHARRCAMSFWRLSRSDRCRFARLTGQENGRSCSGEVGYANVSKTLGRNYSVPTILGEHGVVPGFRWSTL